MNNLPLIVSFFTADWEYPIYANLLKKNCKDLKLDFHIVERPTTGDYIRNTSIKPFFIRECLDKFKRPILWIDCDGSLLQIPSALAYSNVSDYDLGARVYSGPVDRAWHVGTLWFNSNEKTLQFVNDWCELSESGTDENSFDSAWTKHKKNLNVYSLSSDYFSILTRRNPDPPENAVIVHRLSASPDKLKRKYPESQEIEK